MKFFVMGNFEDTPEGWAMTFVQENEPHSIYLGKAELMQFIGLKDKKGKEIYEGDIVKHAGWVCKVVYGENGCCFSLVTKVGDTDLSVITEAAAKHIEVIGNIYENPELLK